MQSLVLGMKVKLFCNKVPNILLYVHYTVKNDNSTKEFLYSRVLCTCVPGVRYWYGGGGWGLEIMGPLCPRILSIIMQAILA